MSDHARATHAAESRLESRYAAQRGRYANRAAGVGAERGGQDAGRLLGIVHMQALRLAEFRLAIDRGATADQVVKQARPPVFFRRQRLVMAQLRAWSLSDLVTAGSTLSANVLAARQNAGLAEAIAGRSLLSLARKGLALRLDR